MICRSEFRIDLKANSYPRPTKRIWWILLLIRIERAANARTIKRLIAALKKIMLFGTASELPASSFCGAGISIPHLSGIIVTPYASIGPMCKLHQQVTIGLDEFKSVDQGPVLGKGVFVGAGAKIIGPIHVGDNVVVGANAVVTKNVPADTTVVGANILRKRRTSSHDDPRSDRHETLA